MMKKIIFFSLVLFALTSANAQDESTYDKTKKLGFSFGLGNAYLSDPLLSAPQLKGRVPTFGLGYFVDGQMAKKNVQLFASFGDLQPDVSAIQVTRYAVDLSYDFLFRMSNSPQSAFQTWVGPSARANLHLYDFNGLDGTTWKFSYTIDAKVGGVYSLSENHILSAHFSTPVLGSVIRPPFAGFDDRVANNESRPLALVTQGGKWTGFWNNLVIRFDAAYNFKLSDQFNVNLGWDFEYQKYNDPKTIKQLAHRLQIGLAWNL